MTLHFLVKRWNHNLVCRSTRPGWCLLSFLSCPYQWKPPRLDTRIRLLHAKLKSEDRISKISPCLLSHAFYLAVTSIFPRQSQNAVFHLRHIHFYCIKIISTKIWIVNVKRPVKNPGENHKHNHLKRMTKMNQEKYIFLWSIPSFPSSRKASIGGRAVIDASWVQKVAVGFWKTVNVIVDRQKVSMVKACGSVPFGWYVWLDSWGNQFHVNACIHCTHETPGDSVHK